MVSLKAFSPILADALGLTPAAMYERQRALVRANILPTPVGRGRGNGLPATPENVAILLIAVLVTDNLSEIDNRVSQLANAPFDSRLEKSCLLTGKLTFKQALAEILASDVLARDVHLDVSRSDLTARIFFYRGKRRNLELSNFGRDRPGPRRIEVVANLPSQVIRSIWSALHSPLEEVVRSIQSTLRSTPEEPVIESAPASKIKGQSS